MPSPRMYDKAAAERDDLRAALETLVEALWDADLEIEPADHPVNVAYMNAQKVLGQSPMRPRGSGSADPIDEGANDVFAGDPD